MTDVEPAAGRYRLPLFPLPVVLLPGTAMPLHIFEPRYRAMVRDCMEGHARFGLIYHDWDRQGPFLSEEGRVGCVAEIRQHQALDDGRSLLLVEGAERFAIVDDIESGTPYFEVLVTPHTDIPSPDAETLLRRRHASIGLFEQVVASLAERPGALPEFRPEGEVSFLLARTVQVDPIWHQQLLELRDEGERLDRLDTLFRAVLE